MVCNINEELFSNKPANSAQEGDQQQQTREQGSSLVSSFKISNGRWDIYLNFIF